MTALIGYRGIAPAHRALTGWIRAPRQWGDDSDVRLLPPLVIPHDLLTEGLDTLTHALLTATT